MRLLLCAFLVVFAATATTPSSAFDSRLHKTLLDIGNQAAAELQHVFKQYNGDFMDLCHFNGVVLKSVLHHYAIADPRWNRLFELNAYVLNTEKNYIQRSIIAEPRDVIGIVKAVFVKIQSSVRCNQRAKVILRRLRAQAVAQFERRLEADTKRAAQEIAVLHAASDKAIAEVRAIHEQAVKHRGDACFNGSVYQKRADAVTQLTWAKQDADLARYGQAYLKLFNDYIRAVWNAIALFAKELQ